MLCEAINIRDVLSRAANFQKELGIVADPSPKYVPIHGIFTQIVSSALAIN